MKAVGRQDRPKDIATQDQLLKGDWTDWLTYVNGGLITVPHVFGVVPKSIEAEIQVTTAVSGYAVGDIVQISVGYVGTTGNSGTLIKKFDDRIDVRIGTQGAAVTLAYTNGAGAFYFAAANSRIRFGIFA